MEDRPITEQEEPFKETVNRYIYNKINPNDKEFPGGRGADELVIYTPEYGLRTGTNEWGCEAIVKGNVVIFCGGNNLVIEKDGFTVSGHGKAQDWIMKNLTPGVKVQIDKERKEITAIRDIDTLKFEFSVLYYGIEKNLILLKEKQMSPSVKYKEYFDVAMRYFNAAESMLKEGNSDYAGSRYIKGLDYITKAYALTMPAYENQIKAVWLRLTDKNKNELEKTVKKLADAGINTIFPETIYYGTSICPPPVDILEQNPYFKGWDPLRDLIEIAHKYKIEVHVWVHVFFIGFLNNPYEVPNKSPLIEKRPDWLAQNKEGKYESELEKGYYYFCPSNEYVRKALLLTYKELIKRYDIDGLQLDYIRYSFGTPIEKGYCYCNSCRSKFFEQTQTDPAMLDPKAESILWEKWNVFRENQITSFVQETVKELKALKPNIKISAAVFPDIEEAAKIKFQNWAAWSDRKCLDFIAPMVYFTDINKVGKETANIKAITKNNVGLAVGLGVFENTQPIHLLHLIREAQNNGANGVVLFSLNQMNNECLEILKYGPFRAEDSNYAEESKPK